MGILKCEINMEDISTKEIFDIIVDGFDELSTRLNDENVSNKKKKKILKFIAKYLNEDDVNKNLDIALKNGLITKEYYLKKQIEDLYKQGLINEECYNWALKAKNDS